MIRNHQPARRVALGFVVMALGVGACGDEAAAPEPWVWDLPEGIPEPPVPEENPMTVAKVELGRHLFYDARLSANGEQACASCHLQELAFTDGLEVAVGSTGELHPRNSLSLTNVAFNSTFTWANPNLGRLEQQIPIPMFGEAPIELGISGNEAEVLARFRDDPLYDDLFARAFPDDADPVTFERITQALASFVRSLLSTGSPFDRFAYNGETEALSDSAIRGLGLFFSERLECHHCHGGFNFSLSSTHATSGFTEAPFHNTGLYNTDGEGGYPLDNQGLYEFTGDPTDIGRFRPPTLRNIALTAPYMHDGSLATLDDVLDFYSAGGRNIESGDNAGDGRANPNKSTFISGFELTAQERADVIAFLESLTDPTFLANPAYSSPF